MGLLSNLFKKTTTDEKNGEVTQTKKTTTDVTFEKMAPMEKMTLENQNGKLTDFDIPELEKFLQIMFDDYDQFITLSLTEAIDGIRYIQACQVPNGITVQLGLEEKDGTKLVEKICSQGECQDIFRDFYEMGVVYNREQYKPVEFMC